MLLFPEITASSCKLGALKPEVNVMCTIAQGLQVALGGAAMLLA